MRYGGSPAWCTMRVADTPRSAGEDRHDLVHGVGRAYSQAERRAQRLVQAAVRHALEFGTWRSLKEPSDLSDADAIELMVVLVEHAVLGTLGGPRGETRPARVPLDPSGRGLH